MLLVACSSQESVDGQYYKISDYGTDLVITIDGDTGTVYVEGSTTNMTIDTDSQTFTIEGFSDPTVEFEQAQNVNTTKKCSESYEEELEKYGVEE